MKKKRIMTMKSWLDSSYLNSLNLNYIDNLKKDFLSFPETIDQSWHTVLRNLDINKISSKYLSNANIKNISNILYDNNKLKDMIESFRFYGHLISNTDPLKLKKRKYIQELDINFYKFNHKNLSDFMLFELFKNKNNINSLVDLYDELKKTYCSKIGFEYMHIESKEEKSWIQKNIESCSISNLFSNKEKIYFLRNIINTEILEKYLSSKFPGTKRFSIEGSDVLIIILKEIIKFSIKNNIEEIILGMSHRGRINTLINIFGKRVQEIFVDYPKQNNLHYSGDVKYHQGCNSKIKLFNGEINISLMFNPSHLEIVNPVVMGFTKFYIESKLNNNNLFLPVTLHGDASICGQGVTQETLNMSAINEYNVGGMIRIIVNNQIGFTTSSMESRSTHYCSDIFKMIQAPIFHVNADDVESVVYVTRIALNFRKKFNKDVVIDLVSYRRHGHNEVDEPQVTQPIMYKTIKTHPTLKEIYSNKLKNNNILDNKYLSYLVDNAYASLDKLGYIPCPEEDINIIVKTYNNVKVSNYYNIDIKKLKFLATKISTIPRNMKLHKKIIDIYKNRNNMALGKVLFDWGGAETLSYASLLYRGISIRLSGEDTTRGTFFHRHVVLHDQENGFKYIPLSNIAKHQGKFFTFNSILSEEASLAFEYGYSIQSLENLVIWEAQFGDFVNGAQIVIDQFISSGKSKWNVQCNIIILLPHGYEGQGPEHSSARIERFLQLCANENMRVCIPSTAAQFYHLIRSQAIVVKKIPLIVMTPKSLLRNSLSFSSLEEISNNNFMKVIDETDNVILNNIKRVIFCSGKIYYDLIKKRKKFKVDYISIIRIEQLYPFPYEEIKLLILKYKKVKDFIWCQEEPKNQGSWIINKQYFDEIIPKKNQIRYIGRNECSSTASGYMSVHISQQEKIIKDALNIK